MKDLTFRTRLYLYSTYLAGIVVLAWNIGQIDFRNPWLLIILCVLASLSLILKVEGATNRSHYTFSFLVYGFTFALYGTPEAILVIIVSNLVEWFWNRPPWYIQLFNSSCYLLVIQVAGFVYFWINPTDVMVSWQAALAIAASMAIFNLMNHLMVGIVLWLARGENLKKSGIFDFFSLMLDLTLLYFGASLAIVWTFNHFALILFLVPIYLIYSTLRVPALERQTEVDNKTGLFNHGYFKQQFDNELNRANRFDRPLSIIMADLDLLRNINNTYGHLAGDEVLIGVARVLKQSVRDYDVVARFGGEEFAILLPETTIQQAYERAEHIRKAIEGTEFTVPTSVSPIRATMSFGIACRESFSQTADEITHKADTALYHSKLSGRNRAFAIAKDAYVNFLADYPENKISQLPAVAPLPQQHESSPEKLFPGSLISSPSVHPNDQVADLTDGAEDSKVSVKSNGSNRKVSAYVGMLALISSLSFLVVYRLFALERYPPPSYDWFGLLVLIVLIASSEWFSIDLYFRQTSISTSAIPILVGYLLFGPLGTLAVSLVLAVSLIIKFRSQFSRFIFNFSNHLLAGALCSLLVFMTGADFLSLNSLYQLGLSLVSAGILYLTTTWLIAYGMSLDLGQPARQIWKEQYSWLAMYYVGIGVIAYALIFGYRHDKVIGILLMVIPMVLLRLSQKQYVNRTRQVVTELREKNQIFKRSSEEILELNEGLLETLSEIIDLRDPYVLGHSKQVSHYATEIAKLLKLNERQIEMIRKGGLLHDIGKLGISEEILTKPARLTAEEFEVIKRHAALGAELVEKSPSLRPLIPIIRHHHEFYNGNGYPDRLRGNQISIEARIVAVADAIEAMSSDHPYRKALKANRVIEEIKKYAGSQFDPLVAEAAVKVIGRQGNLEEASVEIMAEPIPKLRTRVQPS